MLINLPNKLKRETMYRILEKTIGDDLNPKDNIIELNFSSLATIEPAGVTVLSNLINWLDKRGVEVIIGVDTRIPTGDNCPIQYLDDSQFFLHHVQQKLSPKSKVRSTTLPLEWMPSSMSYQWLDNKFVPWLAWQLRVKPETLGTIKTCILEMLNNIRDHAAEHTGSIFAEHYPEENCIKINISDFGVGIPTTIRRVAPAKTKDSEALLLAVREGYTSQSTDGNMGAGLHTLLENVVVNNDGVVNIVSNYGMLSCRKGKNGVIKSAKMAKSFFPGTFIEIILKTDNIDQIQDVEEEFEW